MILKAQRLARGVESETERVFPITSVALRLSWDRITKRADIDDLNFHDLRHEAISRLFELGLTVPEVASISGHRTLAQLMRYSHASQEIVRAKLSRQYCRSGIPSVESLEPSGIQSLGAREVTLASHLSQSPSSQRQTLRNGLG